MDDITLKNYLKSEYRKYPKSIINDYISVSYSSLTTRPQSNTSSRNSTKKSVRFNPLVDVVNIESCIYSETGRKQNSHKKNKKERDGLKRKKLKELECKVCEIF